MPKAGKLIILPLRTSASFPGIPDEVIYLPEVPLPGQDISPTPIPSPSPTPVPVVPPIPTYGLHDIIGMLPKNAANIPAPATHLKSSLTFHWEGADPIAPMGVDATVAFLRVVAQQHIDRDWGNGQRGAYIMYHEAIGQNGDSYIMHDYTDVVWHSGNNEGNLSSRAILVIASAATPPTAAQLGAMGKRAADFKAPVFSHLDWSPTQCPGDVIRMRVVQLRGLGYK